MDKREPGWRRWRLQTGGAEVIPTGAKKFDRPEAASCATARRFPPGTLLPSHRLRRAVRRKIERPQNCDPPGISARGHEPDRSKIGGDKHRSSSLAAWFLNRPRPTSKGGSYTEKPRERVRRVV